MFLPSFFSSTYMLGQRRGFNDQLNDTTKRFTYFAPYDYAWRDAANNYPSTTKKLFMPEFSYHVSKLLKRIPLEFPLNFYIRDYIRRRNCISLNLLVLLDFYNGRTVFTFESARMILNLYFYYFLNTQTKRISMYVVQP
jgi:hypothetical protein